MLDLLNFYVDLINGVRNFVAHAQVATTSTKMAAMMEG